MPKHDFGTDGPRAHCFSAGKNCSEVHTVGITTMGLTTVGLKSGHQSPLDLPYLPRGHGLNTGEALKGRRIQHSLSYKEHQF